MATNGVVEIPALGFSQPFSVLPGAITPVVVPSGAMISTSDVIEEEAAMLVTSDSAVRIYGLNRIPVTTDAFTALPVSSLGQDYLVTAWRSQTYADSELAIAATQADEKAIGKRRAGSISAAPTAVECSVGVARSGIGGTRNSIA